MTAHDDRGQPGPIEDDGGRSQAQIAGALGIGQYVRHLLLCVGPSCCTSSEGQETWVYLKTRLKELTRKDQLPPFEVYRSKVGCLRICSGGPIMVVYPEGIWYRKVTPEVCERILQEHVLGDRIVEEHAFAQNPLTVERLRAARGGEPGEDAPSA